MVLICSNCFYIYLFTENIHAYIHRRRHYPETRTVFAMACILFGTSFMIPLLGLWPQVFSAEVFNTRLAYHSIIDAEDYWTCDKDIKDFLIDEPTTDEALYSMYIFNVSLPNEVYQVSPPCIAELKNCVSSFIL